MKDKHIIDVLDNRSLLNLSESELSEIQVHVRECLSCREAYEAARVSAMVLQKPITRSRWRNLPRMGRSRP